jgi:hypothetical protein
MRNSTAFPALCLLVTPMFGQHGVGARGTSSTGGRVLARRGHTAGRTGVRQRPGNAAYFPNGGDSLGGNYRDDQAGYDNYVPPIANFLSVERPAPPLVAHAVVNEYRWKDAGVSAADRSSPTFTIALKDGSLRYAAATWLQNRQLYYVDSEGKQEVLSSNRIDRGATERLNEEKKLRLQLPPG